MFTMVGIEQRSSEHIQSSPGFTVQFHAPEELSSFVAQKDSHSHLESDPTTPIAVLPLRAQPSESPNTGGSEASLTGYQEPEAYVMNAVAGASDVSAVKSVLPTSLPEKCYNSPQTTSCRLDTTSICKENRHDVQEAFPPQHVPVQLQQRQQKRVQEFKTLQQIRQQGQRRKASLLKQTQDARHIRIRYRCHKRVLHKRSRLCLQLQLRNHGKRRKRRKGIICRTQRPRHHAVSHDHRTLKVEAHSLFPP